MSEHGVPHRFAGAAGGIGMAFTFSMYLRVHRLRAASRGLDRQSMQRRELGEIRVLAWKMMRNVRRIAARHFVIGLTEQPRLILIRSRSRIEREIRRLDQRLGEEDRILGDADLGEHAVVADEVLGHRRLRTHRDPVSTMPTLLDVSGCDLEHSALPLAGRESHPRVRGLFGWMWPAVEPDGSLLRVGAEEVLDRDHRLRAWIDFLGDANADRPTVDVRRDVCAALMLGQRQT